MNRVEIIEEADGRYHIEETNGVASVTVDYADTREEAEAKAREWQEKIYANS